MPNLPLGNRDLIRAINRSIILNTIKSQEQVDRAQVARLTGLSPATVTGITAELIEENLIFEKKTGDSRGGRRPILLAINPRGGYVIGVKLMEDHALAALTDLECSVLFKDSLLLPNRSPETAVRTIANLVASVLAEAQIPAEKLLGVGVGLAGVIDSDNGVLRSTPFFDWHDLPLRDLLQAELHAPVFIENDVNTLTLAELWFGSGRGVDHLLTLTVGRGIGLGIVTNGQFYRGAGGGAGEFGHIVVDPDGPRCGCGKKGCLEALIGEDGLLASAHQAFERGNLAPLPRSMDEFIALADGGSPAAQWIFSAAGRALGLQLANLINIFNPQRILISGEGLRYGKWFFDPLRASVNQYAVPSLLADVDLRIEPWGDDVWARGAASVVLRHLFESPVSKDQGPLSEATAAAV